MKEILYSELVRNISTWLGKVFSNAIIGTFNYGIAKYPTKKLITYIPNEFTVPDTFTFVNVISHLDTYEKFLVSYGVASLFTNIPLEETIDISVNLICNNEPDLKISPDELRNLFAPSQSHFTFKGDIFDQVDGLVMGSPLSPVLANVFMGFHESKWIKSYHKYKPLFYTR